MPNISIAELVAAEGVETSDTVVVTPDDDGDLLRPLMLRVRALDQRRPLLIDLVIALGLDAVVSLPLVTHHDAIWVWLLDQGMVLPLIFRRRQPLLVFLVISVVAFLQFLTGVQFPADGALPFALYTVAVHESRWRALFAAGILEIGVVMASIKFAPADGSIIYSVVALTGLVIAGMFVGVTLRTRQAYLESVEARALQLEIDREQESELAATRERTRIAREMHDIVAHSLSVMIALADGAALQSRGNPDQARDAMATVSATGRSSLREMRRMLGVLRDESRPADLAPQPGLDQLPALVETLRLVGPTISVEVAGNPQTLPPTEDATAYRIVQESLTNIVKHADGATRVHVTVGWETDRLRLRIADDGRVRRAPSVGGHGIDGMTERATLFDGTLTAGPGPDGGWMVDAMLPIGRP